MGCRIFAHGMGSSPVDPQLLGLYERYNVAFDEGKPDEFATLFTVDGRFDAPGLLVEGTAALRAHAQAASERPTRTRHFLKDVSLSVDHGHATGHAEVVALANNDQKVRLLAVGRSTDEFVRTDGWRWPFSSRVFRISKPANLA